MSETIEAQQDSKFKTALNSTAVFVKKHETKILAAATVTSVALAALMRLGLVQHDNFLKEKGLYDEFYSIPEIPTLNPSE